MKLLLPQQEYSGDMPRPLTPWVLLAQFDGGDGGLEIGRGEESGVPRPYCTLA